MTDKDTGIMKKTIKGIKIEDFDLAILDVIFYLIISAAVLFIRPSFDAKISTRGVFLQMIVGIIVIMGMRFLFEVYKFGRSGDRTTLIIRVIASDCVSIIVYYLVQHLLNYVDRVELVTVALIVILTMIMSVLIRWLQYYRDKKNIDLSDVIPFSPPDISELEIQEVTNALKSGWITTGPRTKLLEKNLVNYLSAAGCVCLNSNTACLEMTLRLLGIGDGDEVITCAYTYTASASPVTHVGAKLVLVDCNKEDGSIEMDYEAMERAITPQTKAVIPIDLAGIPCDYDRIFEIVNRKRELFQAANDIQKAIGRVVVIADAAHALGAKYHGKMVGAIADFTCFSFHAVKNFTTGEGGALTWKKIDGVEDEKIYKQIQLYSLHGQSKDALAKTQKGSWEYDIVGPWYKCNMTDIAAAIGLAQLERYPAMLKRRKEIIRKYDNALKQHGIVPLEHYGNDKISSGHLYITRIPGITEEIRNRIIKELAERGVSSNVHYKPLPMMTAYKNLGFDIKDYPNTYDKYQDEITLPLYSTLSNDEVAKIIDKYTEIWDLYKAEATNV